MMCEEVLFVSEEVDAFLAHHGIKGMHWGVRKAQESSTSGVSSVKSPSDHAKLKKAAIIGGSIAGAALIAGGTYYLAKNGKLPTSSLNFNDVSKGKNFVETSVKKSPVEPTDIVHVSRGKNIGYKILKNGNLPDYLPEIGKASLDDGSYTRLQPGQYRRYGANLEKAALSFHDPEGRKDASGRTIVHDVILSKEHAHDVTDFDSAKKKAWALVKDDFDEFYKSSLPRDSGDRVL
jgi:hypothetical protein